jgi:hypothetical protein
MLRNDQDLVPIAYFFRRVSFCVLGRRPSAAYDILAQSDSSTATLSYIGGLIVRRVQASGAK